MRLLLYNWVDCLDEERRGGGVTLYQKNLMRACLAAGDIDLRVLSAGISYDLIPGRPRWERLRHGPDEARACRFEIVNSGVLAPAHNAFGDAAQIDHPATVAAFADFLAREGPFDAVHFNNLEGLPAMVLALKERFPATRFVLTLHNYYPLCPQVNLWWQERAHCADFDGGRACTDCLPHRHNPQVVRAAHALAYRLKRAGIRPGTALFDTVFRTVMRTGGRGLRLATRTRRRLRRMASGLRMRGGVRRHMQNGIPGGMQEDMRDGPLGAAPRAMLMPAGPPPAAEAFAARRARMVALINAHCDRVLCVSDRVRALAEAHGMHPGILRTSYIGTAHAARFAATPPRPAILRADGTLGLGYLGYMRADKGFPFLLQALAALPAALAARLHLTVAAPAGEAAMLALLQAVGARCASLTFHDGYAQEALDAILAGVDVGVVPVLWEDALPQVAIEMHARRIPLLTSDRGGARELAGCDAMVFRAGDAGDFAGRIAALLEGRITAAAYWAGPVRAPLDMAAHLAELRGHYAGA
jgi:hypothetical protein